MKRELTKAICKVHREIFGISAVSWVKLEILKNRSILISLVALLAWRRVSCLYILNWKSKSLLGKRKSNSLNQICPQIWWQKLFARFEAGKYLATFLFSWLNFLSWMQLATLTYLAAFLAYRCWVREASSRISWSQFIKIILPRILEGCNIKDSSL